MIKGGSGQAEVSIASLNPIQPQKPAVSNTGGLPPIIGEDGGRNNMGGSGLHHPEKLGTIKEEDKAYDTAGNPYSSQKQAP